MGRCFLARKRRRRSGCWHPRPDDGDRHLPLCDSCPSSGPHGFPPSGLCCDSRLVLIQQLRMLICHGEPLLPRSLQLLRKRSHHRLLFLLNVVHLRERLVGLVHSVSGCSNISINEYPQASLLSIYLGLQQLHFLTKVSTPRLEALDANGELRHVQGARSLRLLLAACFLTNVSNGMPQPSKLLSVCRCFRQLLPCALTPCA
mmetsp:Transcript_50800/g.120706  ORF Transcript_50800/g.120706 Transcript_50800/m.120706 type:complete len:202 (+) Transcript_50800:326-931(+)